MPQPPSWTDDSEDPDDRDKAQQGPGDDGPAEPSSYNQPVTGQIPRLELPEPGPRRDPAQPILSKHFVLLWLIQFLVSMQFYLVTTISAVYAMERFGAGESEAGLTTSAFTIGAVIARLLSGKYMEVLGRRRVLLSATVLFSLVSAAYLPDTGMSGLLVVRFVNGLAFAAITTIAPAAVQSVIPSRRRGEATGYFGMSTTLATALGPALGVLLSRSIGYGSLFLLVTAVALLALGVVLVLRVPEIELSAQQRRAALQWRLSSIIEPRALPISGLMFFIGVAYSTILSFLNAYAIELDLVGAAAAFFVIYAVAIVLTRPFLGRLQDRRGDNSVILPALVLFAGTLSLLAFAVSGWMLLVAGAALGCSFGAIITAAQSAAVKRAPIARVGLTTATFFLCMDLGATVGPAVLGAVIPALGYRGMFLCAAGVVLVCLGYYWLVHGRSIGRLPPLPTGAIDVV